MTRQQLLQALEGPVLPGLPYGWQALLTSVALGLCMVAILCFLGWLCWRWWQPHGGRAAPRAPQACRRASDLWQRAAVCAPADYRRTLSEVNLALKAHVQATTPTDAARLQTLSGDAWLQWLAGHGDFDTQSGRALGDALYKGDDLNRTEFQSALAQAQRWLQQRQSAPHEL